MHKIRKTTTHPGIIYNTSLENTLSNIKINRIFLKTIEKPIGDIFAMELKNEDKKLGGGRIQLGDFEDRGYDFKENNQNAVLNKTFFKDMNE